MTVPYSSSGPTDQVPSERAEFVSEAEIDPEDLPAEKDVVLPTEAQIRTGDETRARDGDS